MAIYGRKKELEELNDALLSKRNEFVVVYGRRRVGKTYLIDEMFSYTYSFYATGVSDFKKKSELSSFHQSLMKYGHNNKKVPSNWFDAFERLIEVLENEKVFRDVQTNKRIVFIDELPWLDTPKSDFKAAFDYFWNSYGAKQKDLLFVVCGSATSWIIKNILASRGGFHNRITRQIHVSPFSLKECEDYLMNNGFNYSRQNIIELYMVFGGIPYYLNMLKARLSVSQNIESLCFHEYGELRYEYNHLLSSLFKNYINHLKVIETLAKKKIGLQRIEISSLTGISGERLSGILLELEECGFIRKYNNFLKNKNSSLYQIIDPFILFSINFINNQKIASYLTFINTPAYYSWLGLSFEIVCLNNILSIKKALGIDKIETNEYSYIAKNDVKKAQIDLLIDRRDGIINLCEMKFSNLEFSIDKEYDEKLRNKIALFKEESKSKSSIALTFISTYGIKQNAYSSLVQYNLDSDSLFN